MNKGKGKQGSAPAKGDPVKYWQLVAMGIPAVHAKVQAGYSKNTSSTQIERSHKAQQAKETVEKQRLALQSIPGLSLTDQVFKYRKMADNTRNNTSDRLKALTRIDSLLNYDAPKTIEIDTRSLIMELTSVSTQELAMIADVLRGEKGT